MKTSLTALIAAVLLFASSQAQALTYYLNQNNSGLIGGPWASVEITDTTRLINDIEYYAVKFVVDPLEEAFDKVSVKNFGLQDFSFNENTGLQDFENVVRVQFTQPDDWKSKYSASSDLGGSGPYGKFELLYYGDGNSRANPLEFYLYSLTDIDPLQFAVSSPATNYIFAAHIAGFEEPGTDGKIYDSAQFATPVPEPGTFALLGAGLLGLFLYRRRTSN